MHRLRLFLATALVLAGSATDVTCGGLCLRPRPDCRTFAITEFGVALAVHPNKSAYGRIWNVGLAHKLEDRFALGGLVSVTDDDGPTVTLAPVARVELGGSLALDLAPGVIVHGRLERPLAMAQPTPDTQVQSVVFGRAPGFAFDASLNVDDWGAVFLRTSVFPYSQVSRSTFTRIDLPGGGTSWMTGPPQIVEQRGALVEHWVGVRAASYPGLALGARGAGDGRGRGRDEN